MIAGKGKRSELYHKSAKDLHPLAEQQKVFVEVNPQIIRWTPAIVTRVPVASQPRSYSLETSDGVQLQRNRRFIRPAASISCKGTAALSVQLLLSRQVPHLLPQKLEAASRTR